jgi:hypothetical protein
MFNIQHIIFDKINILDIDKNLNKNINLMYEKILSLSKINPKLTILTNIPVNNIKSLSEVVNQYEINNIILYEHFENLNIIPTNLEFLSLKFLNNLENFGSFTLKNIKTIENIKNESFLKLSSE